MNLLKDLRGQSIYESQQFSRELLEELFDQAVKLKLLIHNEHYNRLTLFQRWKLFHIRLKMRKKRMVTLFFQPSTRTQASFEIAMWLMGGKVVYSSSNAKEFSSFAKGEGMSDTVKTFCQYCPHVIVIRSHYTGGIAEAIAGAEGAVSVISGGDGPSPGQHPTQGGLDCFSIRERRGTIDGLKIAFVGDLRDSRVINTNCYLLAKYKDITIYFVSDKNLAIKEEMKDYLKKHNVRYEEHDDLRAVADKIDVAYMTREQLEYKKEEERNKILSSRVNNDHLLKRCINNEVINIMQKHAFIMHPFPRDAKQQEIPVWVDNLPSAHYFEEMKDGLAFRMALLYAILVGY